MPPHIKNNLAEDVVAIIQVVQRYRQEACTLTNFNHHAALEDLNTHLCDLLSSMISSPITGRLYLAPPNAYVTPEQRKESLTAQFTPD